MNLKTKWKIRQCALNTIALALTSTATLTAYVVINIAKYKTYGLAIYGRVPQSALAEPGVYFFTATIVPLLPWFIATILVDTLIVEPLLRKILSQY